MTSVAGGACGDGVPAVPPRRRPSLPDGVLAARAAQGDPHAFEELVRRHQRQMFAVALRITNDPDDAEDAAQTGFVNAWRRLPEFRGDAMFSTWLYRIVSNQALTVVRSRSRRERPQELQDIETLLAAGETASPQDGPEKQVQNRALVADLRVALAALPDDLRVCWLAREVDGLSYQEVAAIAGIGFDVARGRIFRARQRLATAMEAWR